MKRLINLALTLMLGSACSLAPLHTPNTARSVGKNKNQFSTSGLILPNNLQYERGITDNFDLGTSAEVQFGLLFTLFGKYALINHQDDGLSLAVLGGASKGIGAWGDTTAYFGGTILSYRIKWFEPFVHARYNYVEWKKDETEDIRNDLDDSTIFTILPYQTHFTYTQVDLGFNFVGERWTGTIGFKTIIPDGSDSSGTAAPFWSLGYKF